MTGQLIKLATVIILIAIIGTAIWSALLSENHDFVVSMTAFSVGIVTFFGVIGLNRSTQDQQIFKGENLRTAIACSLVVSYLFIVCFTAFVRSADTAGAVTQEFVKSFSNVIGITVAFYFGTSAATQIFGKEKREDPNSNIKAKEAGNS